MDDAPSYDRIVADNITAARARRRLSQKDVAARMEALGFGWRQQIVAAAESGRRRIAVAEALGLALALETSFISLLEPVRDDGPIALPSGQTMLFQTVHELIWGGSELTVSWNGNVPEFPGKDPLMSATGYVVPPPKVRR